MLRPFLLLALAATPLLASAQVAASAPGPIGPDGAPPLYVCGSVGAKHYAVASGEGCTLAPPLSGDWRLLTVSRGGSGGEEARYVDVRHFTRNGDTVGVWLAIVKPDSSDAVFTDAASLAHFDMKAHELIDCAGRLATNDDLVYLRNFRTTADVFKSLTRTAPPPKPVQPDSIIEQVANAVCDGGHPRVATH